MDTKKIKQFLKLKIINEPTVYLLQELFKVSETKDDYSFLFKSLINLAETANNYNALKLLCMVSLKISKEQEAYDQILKYSKKIPNNVAILSILSIMETLGSVEASSNYYNLDRDIHIFDINIKNDNLSSNNIIKYIEESSQENYEPDEQSVSKGSVYFLSKKTHKYLDEFINEILNYFEKARLSIEKESPYKALKCDLSKLAFWAVKIKSGGNMEPHFHPKGCLSGVIYLDVDKNRSGDFIVGCSPSAIKNNENEKVVQVQNMRLIIFPSYYFHRTKFNLTAKNRFSMSFDLTP